MWTTIGGQQYVTTICGQQYVDNNMWTTVCGQQYVENSMWTTICGQQYVFQLHINFDMQILLLPSVWKLRAHLHVTCSPENIRLGRLWFCLRYINFTRYLNQK
jgi:hypothetical protein